VFPLQVVRANRFLEQRETDPAAQQPDDLDPAIIGLMNYPSLIGKMNDYIDWTEQLGNAVVDQLEDAQLAIQEILRSAFNLGVLKSDDRQRVIEDGPVIRIMPAGSATIAIPATTRRPCSTRSMPRTRRRPVSRRSRSLCRGPPVEGAPPPPPPPPLPRPLPHPSRLRRRPPRPFRLPPIRPKPMRRPRPPPTHRCRPTLPCR
jgi:hypothetical protein